MTNSLLLNHIGYLYFLHKKYYIKLAKKLKYGVSCKIEENNLLKASMFIDEIENYYTNCSCLTEDEVCNLIVITQKLLK